MVVLNTVMRAVDAPTSHRETWTLTYSTDIWNLRNKDKIQQVQAHHSLIDHHLVLPQQKLHQFLILMHKHYWNSSQLPWDRHRPYKQPRWLRQHKRHRLRHKWQLGAHKKRRIGGVRKLTTGLHHHQLFHRHLWGCPLIRWCPSHSHPRVTLTLIHKPACLACHQAKGLPQAQAQSLVCHHSSHLSQRTILLTYPSWEVVELIWSLSRYRTMISEHKINSPSNSSLAIHQVLECLLPWDIALPWVLPDFLQSQCLLACTTSLHQGYHPHSPVSLFLEAPCPAPFIQVLSHPMDIIFLGDHL